MRQRSEQWYDVRKGKFTASEIYKLLGIKGLGLTGEGYAFEKAVEELFGETEENYTNFDMERGIELEPIAFNLFKEMKALLFIDVLDCGFIEIDEHSGSSPDGLVGVDAVLEIKCPRPNKFFKLVADGEIDKNHFYQMQMQMLSTNTVKAHYFNYCIIDGEEYFHEIEVPRCEKTIELIKARISEAVEIKNEYKQKINNNRQWK